MGLLYLYCTVFPALPEHWRARKDVFNIHGIFLRATLTHFPNLIKNMIIKTINFNNCNTLMYGSWNSVASKVTELRAKDYPRFDSLHVQNVYTSPEVNITSS
jgi:hypothetical protein